MHVKTSYNQFYNFPNYSISGITRVNWSVWWDMYGKLRRINRILPYDVELCHVCDMFGVTHVTHKINWCHCWNQDKKLILFCVIFIKFGNHQWKVKHHNIKIICLMDWIPGKNFHLTEFTICKLFLFCLKINFQQIYWVFCLTTEATRASMKYKILDLLNNRKTEMKGIPN